MQPMMMTMHCSMLGVRNTTPPKWGKNDMGSWSVRPRMMTEILEMQAPAVRMERPSRMMRPILRARGICTL